MVLSVLFLVVLPKRKGEISCQLIDSFLLLKGGSCELQKKSHQTSGQPNVCAVCANKFVMCDFLEPIYKRKISIPRQMWASEKCSQGVHHCRVMNSLRDASLLLMVQTLILNILRNVLLLLPQFALHMLSPIPRGPNCIVTHLLQTEQSISWYFNDNFLFAAFLSDMINCRKSGANLFPIYFASDFLIWMGRAVANGRCANCFCFWHAATTTTIISLCQLPTRFGVTDESCSLVRPKGQRVD